MSKPVRGDLDPFTRRLRVAVELRAVGVNELGRMAGLSPGYGTRLLKGDRGMPNAETCRRLAERLGINLMWLMYGDGPMEPESALEERLTALEKRVGSSPPPPLHAPRPKTASGGAKGGHRRGAEHSPTTEPPPRPRLIK